MKRAVIRSTIFNICFYAVTAVLCIVYFPLLILPRTWFLKLIEFWLRIVCFLEFIILGLRYEVRGREHLPAPPYIVAAKHQSPYETLKLHLLFKDPAVILKKELLKIPFFGLYLAKNGSIAIDRSTPASARESIREGALRVSHQNRPIVIFPQGTRVDLHETGQHKPYKSGICDIQESTQLPIVPLALNTGLFWPRKGWFKSPGKVIFQFLEPIEPGKNKKELMSELEKTIEDKSAALMNEARAHELQKTEKSGLGILVFLVVLIMLAAGYSYLWFEVAKNIKASYLDFMVDLAGAERTYTEPVITGFPGPVNIAVSEETLHSEEGSLTVENLHAVGWPIPGLPVNITTDAITVRSFKWKNPLVIDRATATVTYKNDTLTIHDSEFNQGNFTGNILGEIDLKQEPVPRFDLSVRMKNHNDLLLYLAQNKIIEDRIAMFMGAGFAALANQEGLVEVPIRQRDQTLYAGPLPVLQLPVASLPETPRQAPGNQPAPAQ